MATESSNTLDVEGTVFPSIRHTSQLSSDDDDDTNGVVETSTQLVAKGKSYLSYFFLGVCSAVLYLPPEADNDVVLFKNVNDRDTLKAPPSIALEICYHKPARAQDFQWATNTFIEKNMPKNITDDETDDGATENHRHAPSAAVQRELVKFNALYKNVAMGDRYLLEFIPGYGLSLLLNGVMLGTVGLINNSNDDSTDGDTAYDHFSMREQRELARLIYSIWFGEEAFSDSMKKELLTPIDPPVVVSPSKCLLKRESTVSTMASTISTGSAIGDSSGMIATSSDKDVNNDKHKNSRTAIAHILTEEEGKLLKSLGLLDLIDESSSHTPSSSKLSPDGDTKRRVASNPDESVTDDFESQMQEPLSKQSLSFWARIRAFVYAEKTTARTSSLPSTEPTTYTAHAPTKPASLIKDPLISSSQQSSYDTFSTIYSNNTLMQRNNNDSNSNEMRNKVLFGIGGTLFLLPHLAILLSLPPVLQRRGAPYLPTFSNKLNLMFELIRRHHDKQNLQKRTCFGPPVLKFVDLGSGDGRVVFRAAREGIFNLSVGYEINPALHLWANLRKLVTPKYWSTTKFQLRDLWNTRLQSYDVVAVYGLAPIMDKLGKKLESELKPGSIVVSNVFPFPQWKASVVKNEDGGMSSGKGVYLYQVPDCFPRKKEQDVEVGNEEDRNDN